MTDTNQASEDELYKKLFDIHMKDQWNEPKIKEYIAIIRTEKLKLLAEVDKSMPTAEQLTTKYGYHMPEKQYGYKLALHDIREVLAKLETEL